MQKYLYIGYIIYLLVGGVVLVASAHGDLFSTGVVYAELGVEEPSLLPGSPFYFLKSIGRGIRLFFTFDSVKKAELELKFVDEKFAEVAKTADAKPDSLDRALQNYLDAHERLQKKLESLKGKNKNVDTLLAKLGTKVQKHQKLFEEFKDEFAAEEVEQGQKKIKETSEKSVELKEKEDQSTPKPETPDGTRVTIDATGNFSPPSVKVKKGAKVTWTNRSQNPVWPASAPHPTHQLYPGFDALRGLGFGEEYSFTFDRVGSWKYHDHLNPSKTGTVEVVE